MGNYPNDPIKGVKMKILLFVTVLFAAILAQAKQVDIDTSASKVQWLGQKKVPGGDHKGTVGIKKGMINLNEKNELIGGTIIIDMKSITDTDLSGKWKTKLESHLHSEDFFHTKKHPEASYKITKVEKTRSDLLKVTGNLTLRGKTHPESFEIKVDSKKVKKGKLMMASGELEFDRNKYGVTYNSEASVLRKAVKIAKDKIITDKIKLTVNLQTIKI